MVDYKYAIQIYLCPRLFSDEDDIPCGVMQGNIRNEEATSGQSFETIQEWRTDKKNGI